MFMRNLLYLSFVAILFLASCVSPEKLRKETVYFNQGLDSATFGNFNLEEPVIQKGDLLQIVINTRSAATNLLMSQNLIQPNVGSVQGTSPGSSASTDMSNRYLVDIATGDIKIPLLGVIHADGLTKTQLEKEVIKLASAYVNDEPVVNIRYMNYRVTFLGSVAAPGTKIFESERITFLQGIGEVGGIIPGGDLKNILLIREQNGKRTAHKIDLTKTAFLNSPENFLKQNDVVYVGITDRQLESLDVTAQRRLQYVSLGLGLVNIIFLVTNLFR
jgi:polysaccharide export outer membrane protein